jgi:hypothetical protein
MTVIPKTYRGALTMHTVTIKTSAKTSALNLPKLLMTLAATLLVLPATTASASLIATVFQNGPAFISDSESAPSGTASAELAGGDTVGAGSFSYVGSAYASSTRGSLGTAAQATGVAYDVTSDRLVVHSRSSLSDGLFFNQSGNVTFRLDVQGAFSGDSRGQMTSFAKLELFCGGCNATASTFWRGGSFPFSITTSETVVSNLPGNYQVWLEHTIPVTENVLVPFEARLEVSASPPVNGVARALFDHTAQFQLLMPSGMTFRSQSGDFMTQNQPPTPTVSEPSMALSAFAMLALLHGRRRSAAKRNH